MRNFRFLLSLFIVLAVSKFALAAPPSTIQIAIHSGQESVKSVDIFPVTTNIQNVGKDTLTLHLWICSYDDHWISDNPNVRVLGISCDKNFLQEVKLKPGEIHKRDLNLKIDVAPKNSPVEMPAIKSLRFRLGFTDGNEAENSKLAKSIWSNSITLKVSKQ